jgi:hypothetical protein
MQVRVYFNLHRKLWSVQDAKTRRVVGHARTLTLHDVTFKVSQAGRERVLMEGRKNVHAFACGTLMGVQWTEPRTPIDWMASDTAHARDTASLGRPVTYNPRRDRSFVINDDTREPIHKADAATLSGRMVFALNHPA